MRSLGIIALLGGAFFLASTAGAQTDALEPSDAGASSVSPTPDAGVPDLSLDASAPPGSATDPALVPAPPKPPKFPQFFLFGNGLALLISSLSFGLEILPVTHHSIGLNVHGQYGGIIGQILKVTDIEPSAKGVFVGGGGELGYRFYAYRDGPFGPFIGFSFLGNFYHAQDSFTNFGPNGNAVNYFQFGPATDIGWSFHLDKTTVVALSLGAQYTFITIDANRLADLTALLVGDGIRPRAGIQVGKVF